MRSRQNRSNFFEVTDNLIRGARAVVNGDGLILQKVKECPLDAEDRVKELVTEFSSSRSRAVGMVRSRCSVYPESRLLRVAKLEEPIRMTEPRVLAGIVSNQFRVESDRYALYPLTVEDGSEIGPHRAWKEFFVCGAMREELSNIQQGLLDRGIYPDRLEIGSIATLGALLHLMKMEDSPSPILVLEIGMESSLVFVLSNKKVDVARPISFGLNSMIAVLKKELGLKDDAAARKLFYSDSFDFAEMGPRLIDRLLRELQASVGYYEVQTGQSIGKLFCSLLPGRLSWLNGTFAQALGTEAYEPDMGKLLDSLQISLGPEVPEAPVAWLGLIALMANFE